MGDEAANRGNHLTPALRTMQNDRSMELKGELQLDLEYFAHPRRNLTFLQPIKSDLSNSKHGFGLKPPANLVHSIIRIFNYSIISQCLPRMHADEVATDQELANIRIAARHMTMRVGHLPKRSFNAILIDSVAMPAVIFEYPTARSVNTIGISLMEQPAFHVRWFISNWKE